jgi:hypothetical protein
MTVRDAVRQLESVDEVLHAGAGSVGGGRLLSFEARVEAHDLTDDVQRRVEAAIARGINGNVTVSSTKGVAEDGGSDACVVWAFAYAKKGETVVGGISYDIIEYDDANGVIAIMSDVTGADPASGLEQFDWGDIEWRPNDWD